MRFVVLAIAIVCAALSGWTPAVAQARALAAAPALHERHDGHPDPAHPGETDRETGVSRADCPGDCPDGCRHPAKCVHPMSCAACFALQVRDDDLGRLPPAVSRLRPPRDLPLTAVSPQPAAPPPKTSPSI